MDYFLNVFEMFFTKLRKEVLQLLARDRNLIEVHALNILVDHVYTLHTLTTHGSLMLQSGAEQEYAFVHSNRAGVCDVYWAIGTHERHISRQPVG